MRYETWHCHTWEVDLLIAKFHMFKEGVFIKTHAS